MMLEPAITCLLTTNGNPRFGDALTSLVNQTRLNDLQILVVDSGRWLHPGTASTNDKKHADLYSAFHRMPNIQWHLTGEPEDAKEHYCPVAHWTNYVLKTGMIKGRYFCTFYDDDLYHPTFMEKMAGYLDTHPNCDAVRCSERWAKIDTSGKRKPTTILRADCVLKRGDRFDQVVDGMQVMMRTEAVLRIPYPYLREDASECRHSDGVFFERLALFIPQMDFIDEVLCEHRFTPDSTYTPTQ
jgi:hypothetical protein